MISLRKNKGIVLLNVLALLLVAAILGASVMTFSSTTLQSSTTDKNNMQAYYTARSALEVCIASIENGSANNILNKLLDETNKIYSIESEKRQVDGMGSYQIKMEFTDENLTDLKITSTAQSNGQTYKLTALVKRETETVVENTPIATSKPTQSISSLYEYLVFCTNGMDLGNSVFKFRNGDIFSQGDVFFSNGAEIDGNIKAFGKITTGNLKVGGDVVSNGDISLNSGASVGGNVRTKGKLSASGGINITGYIEAVGDINLTGGTSSAGQYVKTNGNLSLSGGSTLKTGRVQVLGDANISSTITGDLFVRGDCVLSNCQVNGNVYVEGNLTTTANISGNVYVNGNIYRNGGTISKNVYANSSYYIPYNMSVGGSLYYVSDLYFSNSTTYPDWISPIKHPKSWASGELLKVDSQTLLAMMPQTLKDVGIIEPIFSQEVLKITPPEWSKPSQAEMPSLYETQYFGTSTSNKITVSNSCTLEFNSNVAYGTKFEFDTDNGDLHIRIKGNANGSKRVVEMPNGSEILNAGKNRLFIYLDSGVEFRAASNGYLADKNSKTSPSVFIVGEANSFLNFGSSNNSLYAHIYMPEGKVSLGGSSVGNNDKFYGSMITGATDFNSNITMTYAPPNLEGINIVNSKVVTDNTTPNGTTTEGTITKVITKSWKVLEYGRE